MQFGRLERHRRRLCGHVPRQRGMLVPARPPGSPGAGLHHRSSRDMVRAVSTNGDGFLVLALKTDPEGDTRLRVTARASGFAGTTEFWWETPLTSADSRPSWPTFHSSPTLPWSS